MRWTQSRSEVVPIVLLSLLFAADGTGIGSQLTLLVAFLGFAGAIGLLVAGAERSSRLPRTLLILQDTTAEIRVRGAVTLLMVLAGLATAFGLEAILGAFLAGATLRVLDRDQG